MQQECIPVECILSTAVTISLGVYLVTGVYLVPGGVLGSGGVLSPEGGVLSLGVYLVPGVCVCSRGVSAPGGMSAPWGCLLLGVSALGGVCSRGMSALGECLLWRSAPGGVSAPAVSALGGCLLWKGCPLWGWGCVVSQHALRQTPPPPCGQTDFCKIITFATSLRMVNILVNLGYCQMMVAVMNPWMKLPIIFSILFPSKVLMGPQGC